MCVGKSTYIRDFESLIARMACEAVVDYSDITACIIEVLLSSLIDDVGPIMTHAVAGVCRLSPKEV